MFLHIFINRFKCLTRDRATMVWTFLFPILLGTMFKLAIPDAASTEKFQPINIAIVDNVQYKNESMFKEALKSVSDTSASQDSSIMFNVKTTTLEEAEKLLKNTDIIGYIIFDNGPHVVVKESGFNQTILKEFVVDYLQIKSQYENILKVNPSAIQKLMAESSSRKEYIKEVSPSKAEPNDSLSYYYALIAMACLYGGAIGVKEVMNVQADQSMQGARVNLSPTSKMKLFGCSIAAATTVQVITIFVLIAYLSIVLNVNFGNQIGYVLLAGFVSSLTGVSFGAMVASVAKGKEMFKISIVMGLTMAMSFLAGLMWVGIKYIIATKLPILAYLNIGNLISDLFYSLYYYDTYTRYFLNIGLLFSYSVVFFIIVFIVMRRQKYASI